MSVAALHRRLGYRMSTRGVLLRLAIAIAINGLLFYVLGSAAMSHP